MRRGEEATEDEEVVLVGHKTRVVHRWEIQTRKRTPFCSLETELLHPCLDYIIEHTPTDIESRVSTCEGCSVSRREQ